MNTRIEKDKEKAVENQDTAAWANREKSKAVSNVSIPEEAQIKNSKDYVDNNQK